MKWSRCRRVFYDSEPYIFKYTTIFKVPLKNVLRNTREPTENLFHPAIKVILLLENRMNPPVTKPFEACKAEFISFAYNALSPSRALKKETNTPDSASIKFLEHLYHISYIAPPL